MVSSKPQNIDKSSNFILLEEMECYNLQKHFWFNSSSYGQKAP